MNAFSIVRGEPVLGELTQAHTFLQPFVKNIDYYSATINWDAGPVQLVSATSFSRTHTNQFQDATDAFGAFPTFFGFPAGIAFFDLNLDLDKFTQEFRISSPADQRFAWILGAFYTREDSDNSQLCDRAGPERGGSSRTRSSIPSSPPRRCPRPTGSTRCSAT